MSRNVICRGVRESADGCTNANKLNKHHQGRGSMLWSQFSAIFANFQQKIWRFF
jgi:hypothetical protein